MTYYAQYSFLFYVVVDTPEPCLQAVGGYDSFFFKKDKAYMIAFSLSVWSCGGSIVQTDCAQARHMDHSPLNTEQRSVDYLQHAKYIQEVYGGSISLHFTFPGINFYKMSAYEQHAVTERKEMFRSLSCMTLEWYAHKFPKGLPLHPSDSKFYQPDYHPLLPVYQSRVRQVGRLFVLYAGHCVKVDGDQVLGLSWCPNPLPTNYKFIWQDNGQIVANSKCVTVRKDDSILTVADCIHGDDNSQLFVYQKSNKMIVSKHNDQCVTHFNGPNNRQVLRTLNCDSDSPFNKFIINDLY
ncbi:hypothetical protein EB796_017127 [Bugula neritina]|uniref:Ricin B lectin domain-containing protein n=1 Tax=Bugula neritina TaxID=10212 RepID=A0A7J7JEV0_BUGNE|nr:hypothetical protein EB796_017127 [Bugula neritina]